MTNKILLFAIAIAFERHQQIFFHHQMKGDFFNIADTYQLLCCSAVLQNVDKIVIFNNDSQRKLFFSLNLFHLLN